uniref:protein adenylyltransferase SelO n=1 Tax=Colwellia chukchiensis TaxID=641665 RepID=UPI001E486469|nr:YdiU family protein [Colwellia chukchiensis]
MHALSDLTFTLDNQFTANFVADDIADNYPRQVLAAYSYVTPKACQNPTLIAYSDSVLQQLGWTKKQAETAEFLQVFSGSKLLAGMQPFAMCYGGHQFGHWAGQLGDGRAINLAEILTPAKGHKTLQLKGAGPTPYSRSADGFAVLRSSIREFLCSEAMFHLGIATTRALSLSLTGENVVRDMFYDGNAQSEPGAVVCRVSSSFIRFGSFQLPAARQDIRLLTQLVDYVITRDFPHLGAPSPAVYLKWFNEVSDRTCQLVVDWMRVGFVHGVMNTDNMSIIGETIDYGPYGWIDNFDLDWTPNTTDAQGKRYRFGAQGEIAQWNLFQLANAIFPLINQAEPLQQALNDFAQNYQRLWQQMMAAKLGLTLAGELANEDELKLLLEIEEILSCIDTDMTIFYRRLADLPEEQSQWLTHLHACYYNEEDISSDYQDRLHNWLERYIALRDASSKTRAEIRQQMNATNPKYVLRNYLAQQAIEQAEQQDYRLLHQLQQLLTKPYDEQPEFEHFAAKRPAWAKHKAGCSMLSCSS